MFLSRGLLLKWENFQVTKLGPSLRSIGQRLIKMGATIQGEYYRDERLVPSTRCIPISNNVFPKLLNAEWVAPNATIIGDVTVGKLSSFYHGVSIRGDTCKIIIGSKTIIQDNTIISNTNLENKDAEIKIGDKVVIGVNCTIDQCTIEDNAVIGNGATVHSGCVIQNGALVAAGAVIPPNTIVPAKQVWVGNPAKYLRDLKPVEVVSLSENNSELRDLANVMVEETEKTHIQVLKTLQHIEVRTHSHWIDLFILQANAISYWKDQKTDDFGIEAMGEGYDDYEQEDMFRFTSGKIFNKENMDLHYEQNMTNYPDMLKVYGENYAKYDSMRSKFENEVPGSVSPGFQQEKFNQRPGAMRAWINKWDPEYNVGFRQTGTQQENTNG